MRHRPPRTLLFATLTSLSLVGPASALHLTVRAGAHACRDALVRAEVDVSGSARAATLTRDGRAVPAQLVRLPGGRAEVWWVVPELAPGATARYDLRLDSAPAAARGARAARTREGDLELRFAGELFARYDAHTGPNKPYFFPIVGPTGARMVRGYPLDPGPAGTRDHPHHRGLWFTHGAVNGCDYWSEGANTGRTVNRGYSAVVSGPVWAGFRATTDWIDNHGRKVATDERTVRAWQTRDARVLDFEATVRAASGALVFGDTKEGSFGLRVPDALRLAGGAGHILSSTGARDGAAWGKRAEWVDYAGPLDGQEVGIAILDHPGNPRHPTYWHVRDYGLFAANPFGVHDFARGQPAGAGDLEGPVGGSVTFRDRVVFHRGGPDQALLADRWATYADPPTVTVD